jgi:hypothetical protein
MPARSVREYYAGTQSSKSPRFVLSALRRHSGTARVEVHSVAAELAQQQRPCCEPPASPLVECPVDLAEPDVNLELDQVQVTAVHAEGALRTYGRCGNC